MRGEDWRYADARPHTAWRAAAGLAATTVLLLCATVFVVGPAFGAWRLLPILSGSMRPDLPVGALAIATPEFVSDVHAGQVIIFRLPVGDHRTVAHRVTRVIKRGSEPIVQTKGDANPVADPFQAQLQGSQVWLVRWNVPLVGYAVLWAQRARLLIAALLAAVLIIPAALFWGRRDAQLSVGRLRRARER